MSSEGLSDDFEREETFLARYPRWLKIDVAVILLGIGIVFGVRARYEARTLYKAPEEPVVAALARAVKNVKPVEPSTDAASSENPYDTVKDESVLAAMRENDTDDRDARMVKAPAPSLSEVTSEGSLPRISDQNRKPWEVYARPFNMADRRPRIALVIGDLGLSNMTTLTTVERMPSSVTLAFDVQSPIVGSWLARVRQLGHETLLSVPMEPLDYPRSDPGPKTLLTHLPTAEIQDRLKWALRQGNGYVGITTLTGSRFTAEADKLAPIIDTLRQRGLMILDSRVSQRSLISDVAKQQKVPYAVVFRRIDENPSPDAIDAALAELEKTARLSGQVVGYASPLPVTIDRLELWRKQLTERGLVLAPLSAVVE